MHIFKKVLLSLAAVVACSISPISQAEVTAADDGGAQWQAGVNGVTIEWAPDGSVKRIYSEYAQAVSYPDRRGINRAHIIAQEKAKAEIIRFMSESMAQERTIETIDSELETAQRRISSEGEQISRDTSRKMTESLREVTRSYAAGKLQGIIVLEKGYNEEREEAWVKVGMSKRTIAAANAVRDMVNSEPGHKAGQTQSTASGSAVPRQNSEVIRSAQEDW